jgi:hypothetical protein
VARLALAQSWGGGASTTRAVIVPTAATLPVSRLLWLAMPQPAGASTDQLPRMWSPAGSAVLRVMSALKLGSGLEMAVICRVGLKVPPTWAPMGPATYSTASATRAAMIDEAAHVRPGITGEPPAFLDRSTSGRGACLSRSVCLALPQLTAWSRPP